MTGRGDGSGPSPISPANQPGPSGRTGWPPLPTWTGSRADHRTSPASITPPVAEERAPAHKSSCLRRSRHNEGHQATQLYSCICTVERDSCRSRFPGAFAAESTYRMCMVAVAERGRRTLAIHTSELRHGSPRPGRREEDVDVAHLDDRQARQWTRHKGVACLYGSMYSSYCRHTDCKLRSVVHSSSYHPDLYTLVSSGSPVRPIAGSIYIHSV